MRGSHLGKTGSKRDEAGRIAALGRISDDQLVHLGGRNARVLQGCSHDWRGQIREPPIFV
jgi:hypothetical protein